MKDVFRVSSFMREAVIYFAMKFRLTLCLISGVLTGLSFNSPCFSYFVWFSLVPFLYAINKSDTKKEGILYGIIFGLAYFGTSIFWVSRVTLLGLFFLLIYLAVYPAVFFLTGRYFFKKPASLITIPLLWVILEFVQENVWCGFGWASLGYSQYTNLYLIQPADLFGVKFISFIIVLINVLIWEILFKRNRVLRKILFVSVIISSCGIYSFYRLNGIKTTDYVDVSLVQPNIAQALKWQETTRPVIINKLKDLVKETQENSLVIFPEAAWPYVVDLERGRGKEIDIFFHFFKEIKRDNLIGGIRKQDNRFYNTAFLFDKNSSITGLYHKIKLVPFGEYVPLRDFLGFIEVLNAIGDMSRGVLPSDFIYRDKKFSVLICFEDIFPGFVRSISKEADFLINITNDGWFHGQPQAGQHLGIMVFRAIENRISIIRCANTGISGWVSAKGQIQKLKKDSQEVFFEGTGNFKVILNKERSFYHAFGETFPLICGLILLGIIIIRREDGDRVRGN